MKMKRTIVSLALALALTYSLAGCTVLSIATRGIVSVINFMPGTIEE